MTNRMTYDIIDTSKGGETMRKRRKKDREWSTILQILALLTAALDLLSKIVELLGKLFE